MSTVFTIIGALMLASLWVWKYLETHHGSLVKKYKEKLMKTANTPEEYRRLAKKSLREKRFLEAEEYYARAKMLEERG